MATNKSSRVPMIIVGILSLLGLLSYTFVHTGNLLASYVSPQFVGFMAAFGIELSIVGLSMRIGELKRLGLSYRFFVFTLVAVVAVSALANIAEGFHVKFGEALTVINWNKLDVVQIVVSIAATGLISLVTLALSEIVGQDVATAQKSSRKSSDPVPISYPYETELAQKKEEQLALRKVAGQPLLQAPKVRTLGHVPTDQEFMERMNTLGDNAPKTVSEVESIFALSHATAARRLAKYREASNG